MHSGGETAYKNKGVKYGIFKRVSHRGNIRKG